MRTTAVLAVFAAGCVVTAPPASGPSVSGAGTPGTGGERALAARSGAVLECPFGPAAVPLGVDRVLRCRGFPFEVTFPSVPGTVQRTDASGTTAMAFELIEGSEVGALGLFARPSPMVDRGRLGTYLDELMGAIVERSLHVEQWTEVSRGDVTHPGALAGRSLVFAARVGGGEIRAFWIEPWIVAVIAAGTPASTFRHDRDAGRAYFASFRHVALDGGTVQVALPSGTSMAIPGDAWLANLERNAAGGVLEERLYDAPSLGGILMLRDLSFGGASCQQLVSATDAQIFQALAGTTGDAQLTRVEHATIAGAPAIYTEATIQTEWDRLKGYPMHPAVGYFVCGRTSVHILLGGSSSHATQRATLDRLSAGLRLAP